ncbi:MAG: inter-alpha-trypsin inhibitor domain-containing protein [Gemmatales bacterium]|nr:MAG: inter-alpha-trypsin inhibitor domain-containing protein [Gemmatales bacterium]
MRRYLSVLTLFVLLPGFARSHGLLIPADKKVPPLAMLNHQVQISMEDQVTTTRVEQTFRNHTSRNLEATYVFPVPKGASVRDFSMWVNGKEVRGELLPADQARKIYTEIVRRTQDPGLLDYVGNNLFRLRVFPIAPNSDQKVSLTYTSVAPRDRNVVEYIYPLKTDGKATRTLEKFSIKATIKSRHAIYNVYSPTHAISIKRQNDHHVDVEFEREQGLLDRDFQVFYSVGGGDDVGLTVMHYRPISSEKGHVMMLLSPRVELPEDYSVARDMVFVLDTSGSMRGAKISQARKALKYCLQNLRDKDRFGLIQFATTVNPYRDELVPASREYLDQAGKWVDGLTATGGTAINAALEAALAMRTNDKNRTFTVLFFTDGLPTIGETKIETILKNVANKNTANTRIFTFGVGNDVNATLLDQIADNSRALSTYVRPAEDISDKVASLYNKISHPVLANLKLSVAGSADGNFQISEVYPPRLPDLFHGGQLVVLGRYDGKGNAAIKLTGTVGDTKKEFVYEIDFPAKTGNERDFVAHLWARRKVGYLLDQIRANGEKKELVEEVVALAKKFGIATPYTSYLIVPDGTAPVVARQGERRLLPNVRFAPNNVAVPEALAPGGRVVDLAKNKAAKGEGVAQNRGALEDQKLADAPTAAPPSDKVGQMIGRLKEQKEAFDRSRRELNQHNLRAAQQGWVGVALSQYSNTLKTQKQLSWTAMRNVQGRNCVEYGGVWIDEDFRPQTPTLTIKAQSNAYFRMLELHPEMKDVFRLGNFVVWIAPNGTALVVDANDGKEELADDEINKLFEAKK